MSTYSSANESTRLLEQSVRIARENESIAERTTLEVLEQGEKLDDAKDMIDSVKDISVAARTSVNAMRYKVFSKKIKLWAVILGLFGLDILLMIKMYYNHGSLYA
mmetsp:Transcript_35051/g.69599  ORF Transcript_35051/g.69599 Transcript_35051/m.69599 type:complete len:105 (-) Transcript_35051:41-355(-)